MSDTDRALTLREWVQERSENCEKIAKTKAGSDREGWIEDAGYFRRMLIYLTPSSVENTATDNLRTNPYEMVSGFTATKLDTDRAQEWYDGNVRLFGGGLSGCYWLNNVKVGIPELLAAYAAAETEQRTEENRNLRGLIHEYESALAAAQERIKRLEEVRGEVCYVCHHAMTSTDGHGVGDCVPLCETESCYNFPEDGTKCDACKRADAAQGRIKTLEEKCTVNSQTT